jgi:predicted metal-dependent phosphoesterase TrpH
MPRGQPFTALCQLASQRSPIVVADLHLHTTSSDGEYTPSQIVALARQKKLKAIAITDHDTLAGYFLAEPHPSIRLIPGIEFSTLYEGQELHLLGYGFNPLDQNLTEQIRHSVEARRRRFRHFAQLLRQRGVTFPEGSLELVEKSSSSLGRRHLAQLLVRIGSVRNRVDAFQRFLEPLKSEVPREHCMPITIAISLIRNAGGIAALAHPPSEFTQSDMMKLTELGLNALEVRFPAANSSRTQELIAIARSLSLRITGGSDCHGPERIIGTIGINKSECDALLS